MCVVFLPPENESFGVMRVFKAVERFSTRFNLPISDKGSRTRLIP